MAVFWTLWSFNALVALVPIYFFFVGLADGSITSRNIGMWFIIILIVVAIIGGSIYLKNHNQMALARTLLILAAIPGILAILYFVIVFTSNTRWN
ncbi:MAG: osmoprotectant transporter permease [Bacteroidota bacterium]|nr:osmoprotectant transporter permease [Bacteroidota bacterium]